MTRVTLVLYSLDETSCDHLCRFTNLDARYDTRTRSIKSYIHIRNPFAALAILRVETFS